MTPIRALLTMAATSAAMVLFTPGPAQAADKNCAQLRAEGLVNIPIGHPAYRPELDEDGDGVGCEDSSRPLAVIPSASASTRASVRASVRAGADELPITGPPAGLYVAGGLLVSGGLAMYLVARRRSIRFRA